GRALPVVLDALGPTELGAQDSFELLAHVRRAPQSLISMSTPAGRSSRISESTVFGVGSMMSIRRLCVRISKCSRESLYLCGDRITQYTFFSVGSGTGPATRAPVRVTVSTIFRAELSMTSWSYALSLMRIFCPAMWLPTALQKHCLRFVCRDIHVPCAQVPAGARLRTGRDSPWVPGLCIT